MVLAYKELQKPIPFFPLARPEGCPLRGTPPVPLFAEFAPDRCGGEKAPKAFPGAQHHIARRVFICHPAYPPLIPFLHIFATSSVLPR